MRLIVGSTILDKRILNKIYKKQGLLKTKLKILRSLILNLNLFQKKIKNSVLKLRHLLNDTNGLVKCQRGQPIGLLRLTKEN